MLDNQRVVVVMPAYNAELTLERTYAEIPRQVVDAVILVDDSSSDGTVALARRMGIHTLVHDRNTGYGGNQKSCYQEACRLGADIVVMLHPDYQYSPRLITTMASMIASGHYDVALGSRILDGKSRHGGMPLYKYISNRILTLFQNLLLGAKLSEYHTGYRAFSRRVLEELPLLENSDNFLFDNQMLAQALYFDFQVGEISCPCRYFPEASSIRLGPSLRYGVGVLATSVLYLLNRWGVVRSRIFSHAGRRLSCAPEEPGQGGASQA